MMGLLLTVHFLLFLPRIVSCEPFIGWKGATYDPVSVWDDYKQTSGNDFKFQSSEKLRGEKWIQVISKVPRAYYFHNFLTEWECKHIINLASPWMKRSTVVGGDSYSIDDIRTSYGTFIPRLSDPAYIEIAERVAMWTHIPAVHQEDMQVLRYEKNQKYTLHGDVIPEENKRTATVIVYLSDVEEGGETAFPHDTAKWYDKKIEMQFKDFSPCAKETVAVKPKMGDALLFFSLTADGSKESESAWHTGCPVIRGVKWSATFWIHQKPFRPEKYVEKSGSIEVRRDPGLCDDYNSECRFWAKIGECHLNKPYMEEQCRLACNLCTPCEEYDDECYKSNRITAGYLNIDTI